MEFYQKTTSYGWLFFDKKGANCFAPVSMCGPQACFHFLPRNENSRGEVANT
jgi:hypothetical protein